MLAVQGLERRRFLNWESMLRCSTKRAMGNASDDTPLDMRQPPRNPWLDGWADVLDIINSHAQACALALLKPQDLKRVLRGLAAGHPHGMNA